MDKENVGIWIIFTSVSSTLALVLLILGGTITIESAFLKGVWDFIISQLTTFITLGALIVAIINVSEIRKQRKKMYEPSLILQETSWKSSELPKLPFVKLTNIGFGSAINLKISWDYSSVISGDTKYIKGWNNLFATYKSTTIINTESDSYTEYVLPVSVDDTLKSVELPQICVYQILSKIEDLLEDVKSKGVTSFNTKDYFIHMFLEYRDINGEVKKETYKICVYFLRHVNSELVIGVKPEKIAKF